MLPIRVRYAAAMRHRAETAIIIGVVSRSIRHVQSPWIVGVIDLLRDRAVHARGGDRSHYQPVTMRGIPEGDAPGLARFYADRVGLTDVYVADLDAIAGQEWQCDRIREIATVTRSLWLDAAITAPRDASRARSLGASRVVVGLETLPSLDALRELCAAPEGGDVVLSLDLRAGRVMTTRGLSDVTPPVMATRAQDVGVRTIIVLDVARVGTATGCDVEMVAAVRTAAPSVALLAGGGVRDAGDVRRLRDVGCDGVLAATALMREQLVVSQGQSTDR
jgi:phosphoribosylformimino-5-aminoimidazole carboxamide ribotide isomerase